nr:hypothetical protein [uncultured Desulfobulbus sp.]
MGEMEIQPLIPRFQVPLGCCHELRLHPLDIIYSHLPRDLGRLASGTMAEGVKLARIVDASSPALSILLSGNLLDEDQASADIRLNFCYIAAWLNEGAR